jgi:hypothetical protein
MTSEVGTAWLEVGDPSFIGWFTSAAYLLAAAFAVRAGRALRSGACEVAHRHRLAAWWLGVAVLLLVLGLNKELDLLQKLVRSGGKALALKQGWYQDRKTVQAAFIVLLGLLSAGAALAAALYFRHVWFRIAMSAAGVALIVFYALLRATEFHVANGHVPEMIASLDWIPEIAGVMIVLWCALAAGRSRS